MKTLTPMDAARAADAVYGIIDNSHVLSRSTSVIAKGQFRGEGCLPLAQ